MNKIYLILSTVLILSINTLKAQFSASNFTMISNINPEPTANSSGNRYSACWGWTNPLDNKEYAIACSQTGTYWIDVTNPATPTVCAFKAGASTNATWRETKTYQNYCYVVSDDNSATGLQIFDMSTLPTTVTLVSHNQNLFKRGHACWVDGNKLYVSGVTYSVGGTSSMDVYSLATPTAPVLLRRLNQDYNFITYVHDEFVRNDTVYASCGYQGLYVFKYNTGLNTFTQLGSLTGYTTSAYNHATSLTPDGHTLVMLDEVPASLPVKIVDVSNLSNINIVATTNQYTATTPHNPWVVNNQYCFISSYKEGTQLYDISNPSAPFLAGYFDTYFQGGGNTGSWAGGAYNGQWGLYAYFPSKNIFALDMTNGVFMLSTHLFANPEINLQANSNNIIDGSSTTSNLDNTDFGTVNVGNNLTNTFVIQNTGIGTLSITGINFTGANASEYNVLGGPSFPFTVAPSGSQTINIQYAPIAAGTSSALVTLTNNDLNESAYDFVISGTGSVVVNGLNSNSNQSFNLSLFPNPAQNEIEFNMPFYSKDLLIKVYDTQGKLIIERTNTDILKLSNTSGKMNVSELTNGLYYFSIISNTKSVASKKLIINK
ncbi:MAG: choice-of-anchor B family protein [Bacteroidota bacterium]|nr:choice-of-anchor B family protein [Bacteroidota bacterium]